MLGLVDSGATDFFGGAIPAYGAFDLGAHEAFAPGDFNGDGSVDAADYAVWRDNFGTNNVLLNDPIGGMITQDQYDVWKSNFGATMGSGSGASGENQSVPEPAILAMLASVVFRCAVFTRHAWPKSSRQDSAAA
jgi:hypothetical protein